MGGMTQRLWSPTKRRGPIAAEFGSPGPACVTLPSLLGKTVPDSKRGRAPAFSFGIRYLKKNESPGPGPGQYNVSGLNAKGKDTAPALTLHGRTKMEKIECTPAPGDYDPQKAEKMIQDNSPKYSFGVKINTQNNNFTPAPWSYYPEKVNLHKGPEFSLSGKGPASKINDVPAPGTYSPEKFVQLDRSPHYTFGSRTTLGKPNDNPAPGTYAPEKHQNMNKGPQFSLSGKPSPKKQSDSPGPGLYSPEKSMVFWETPFKFTFGFKLPINLHNNYPAPNVYTIPSALGGTKESNKKSAPAFSIASRQKVFPDDTLLVPGPGAYEAIKTDIVRMKSAAYSIGGRYQIPSGQEKIPAPGTYSPEKVMLDISPAHTFGIKHSPYICNPKDAVF